MCIHSLSFDSGMKNVAFEASLFLALNRSNKTSSGAETK